MGTVITFPEERRYARAGTLLDSPATVIILPVIRIERHDAPSDGLEPDTSPASGRKRRRRVRS